MCGAGVVMHWPGLAHLRSGPLTVVTNFGAHPIPDLDHGVITTFTTHTVKTSTRPVYHTNIIANTTRNYFWFGWPFKNHFFKMLVVITV